MQSENIQGTVHMVRLVHMYIKVGRAKHLKTYEQNRYIFCSFLNHYHSCLPSNKFVIPCLFLCNTKNTYGWVPYHIRPMASCDTASVHRYLSILPKIPMDGCHITFGLWPHVIQHPSIGIFPYYMNKQGMTNILISHITLKHTSRVFQYLLSSVSDFPVSVITGKSCLYNSYLISLDHFLTISSDLFCLFFSLFQLLLCFGQFHFSFFMGIKFCLEFVLCPLDFDGLRADFFL